MEKELIFEGKTLENALEKAQEELGVGAGDLSYSLVEDESGGLFSLGSDKVVIRVEPSHVDRARKIVESIVSRMGFTANYSVSMEEKRIFVNIDCPQKGLLIGRHGATLEALQGLVNIIFNKDKDEYVKIIIDVDGYRSKKKEELVHQVEKIMVRVKQSGRPVKLPQVNSYDRRTIHMLISEKDDFVSYSEGEGKLKDIYIDIKHNDRE